jgi:hypothetical protein
MRNITECQRRLIALGYLPARNSAGELNDDGKFGVLSLDAYNRFLARRGRPPVKNVSMAELNADLFPEEQPAAPPPKPNLITKWLTDLAIKQVVSKLKDSNMSFLSGYKTYATAVVIAIMGLYSLVFGELPLVGQTVDPGSAILAILSSFGLGFARTGAKTESKKTGL